MNNIEKYNKHQDAKSKLGILGGTFDPIHIGHLFIAETALEQLNLDKIIFIPTGIPPHKNKQRITSSDHRLHMTSLAISSNPRFKLSEIEINRKGISYTYDTICEMLDRCQGDVDFYFIIGTDAFTEIETWKNYISLFHMVKIVIVTRTGYDDSGLHEKIQYYNKKHNTEIINLTIPILQISSSGIRERIKQGESIKYLVTENVEKYIKDNDLYNE